MEPCLPTTRRVKRHAVKTNTSNLCRVCVVTLYTPNLLPRALLELLLLITDSLHISPGGIRDISHPLARDDSGRYTTCLVYLMCAEILRKIPPLSTVRSHVSVASLRIGKKTGYVGNTSPRNFKLDVLFA